MSATGPSPHHRARALMIQGTGSDVGKSLLVSGLARALTRRGLRVAPFKAQNMSNNAAVTADGGEIGRAQALQARACGLVPSVDMNPVLLKPQSETGSQLIVQGRVAGTVMAGRYRAMTATLMPTVLESFARLRAAADIVLVEGAGSPAEVNLRAGDIANMGFAEAADVPVVIVGDIDRGGVIAALVGTHVLLPEAERRRIAGFLINKFRGDVGLFEPALAVIEGHTGWAPLGVIPWFPRASALPAEDAQSLESRPAAAARAGDGRLRIVVPRLSRIANFDDFDPLIAEPDVDLRFIGAGEALPGDADLVILPGSKATLADLAFLRAQGWDGDLLGHHRRGGRILGLCAGYQMLGRRVADPQGVEGPAEERPGLGFLDVDTVMGGEKTLTAVRFRDHLWGAEGWGYEMHVGRTQGPDTRTPWLHDGSARSADGRVLGAYVHGLFASDAFRRAFLGWLRPGRTAGIAYDDTVEATLDALADHLERHVALDRLLALAAP
ncbi:cobyric acid synthase [Rhodospirillum rubrum F11]|uniref:Cobyric acid synthase n=2 Tax=Rhodospirillum rubrum TaxID=1085 RepID=Q2RNX0_RHORT|nr:adenosylcobyric acid synthase (glutamine-hydrolysing) [Rhodospirillum rubrum ATCC 11170]AEO49926.1 cobyric acid synthase [Rhodospirillum rubrum F11]MBK5955888.1 cobyric acid synthase CobQ [Rhodospirillum rubrum]QXG80112.1 cobyric acid synthase [Rhodospirillum rubrum]HCF18930.1 cobyric acid synthase [Rhodospirillum rubrum]